MMADKENFTRHYLEVHGVNESSDGEGEKY